MMDERTVQYHLHFRAKDIRREREKADLARLALQGRRREPRRIFRMISMLGSLRIRPRQTYSEPDCWQNATATVPPASPAAPCP